MTLIDILIVVMLLAWVMGTVVVPVGPLIHLVLIVMLILILARLLQGRGV